MKSLKYLFLFYGETMTIIKLWLLALLRIMAIIEVVLQQKNYSQHNLTVQPIINIIKRAAHNYSQAFLLKARTTTTSTDDSLEASLKEESSSIASESDDNFALSMAIFLAAKILSCSSARDDDNI